MMVHIINFTICGPQLNPNSKIDTVITVRQKKKRTKIKLKQSLCFIKLRITKTII